MAIEALDRGLRAAIIHLHESKASRTTSIPVVYERDGMNRAVLAEQLVDLNLGRTERQVADIKLLQNSLSKRPASPVVASATDARCILDNRCAQNYLVIDQIHSPTVGEIQGEVYEGAREAARLISTFDDSLRQQQAHEKTRLCLEAGTPFPCDYQTRD
jgi:hypothetical protein